MAEILTLPGLTGFYGWITPLLIVLSGAFVALAVSFWLRRLQQQASRQQEGWLEVVAVAAVKPVLWLIAGLIVFVLLRWGFSTSSWVTAPLFLSLPLVFGTVALCWFLLGSLSLAAASASDQDSATEPGDRAFSRSILRYSRLLVVTACGLMLLQTLGFQLWGVLMLLAVFGLIAGFSARDLLLNVWGGVALKLDRQFKQGDWVSLSGDGLEGVVEHIGLRQTRLRKFDMQPLFVPNALFNTLALENASRSTHRRIQEHIGIRLEDLEVIREIINEIRRMLMSSQDIDSEKTLVVSFDRFGESSAEILVYAFTRTREWGQFQALRQETLLRIHDIIAGHGAEIPTPTRTLHVDAKVRRLQGFSEDMVA